MWGTGASSTQTEGAAPASDYIRREQAGLFPESGTGNDFGTRYAEDFAIYQSLGLTHHRLSIEWARIEPVEGERDPQAIAHYRDMLEAAHNTGVVPWITLHHNSLPQWFADKGGFADETARTTSWRDHVAFMADAFGDLAGGWKPVNETNYYGLLTNTEKLTLDQMATAMSKVNSSIHLATCEAAKTLQQTGKPVASIYGLTGAIPVDDHPDSIRRADEFYAGSWDAGIGLFRDGVLAAPGEVPIERPDLKDCYDLIGFSYYACVGFKEGVAVPYPLDTAVSPLGYGIWADGLGVVLDRLAAQVPNMPILVDEYGVGTDDDAQRAAYLQRGLEVAHDAIARGIDLRGFFHWTGVDNYEWRHGYTVKFGIIERDRTIKPSAQVLAAEALSS